MGDLRYQVFAIALTVAFLCCIDAAPSIVSAPETVQVSPGQTVVLRCRVQGLGPNDILRWRSVSADFVIFRGNKLVTSDVVKYSLINVPEGINYNLQVLEVEKSDQGFYECNIVGTNQSVISRLDVIGEQHIALPTGDPLNVTDCCLLERMDESCLPACYPDGVDLDKFDAKTKCGSPQSLKILSKCFTSGSNHDNCCLFSGVDPLCLDFCHNTVPDTLTEDQQNKCYNSGTINSIFRCFAMGFEYLPSEPTNVVALAFSKKILVKWAPPRKNADTVTGYKIMYKPVDGKTYYTELVKNPQLRQYQIQGAAGTDRQIKPNTAYHIRLAALADYGVSFGSIEIDTFTPDDSLAEEQTKSISECCTDRNVNKTCQDLLCHTLTWSHFNMDHAISCLPYIDDVFTCLAGEQDHTPCCRTYGVQPACLPMCSGKPPQFDVSILHCVSQMDLIEGCVQQGYSYLPKPPSALVLLSVDSTSAIIKFTPSTAQDVVAYVVELHSGNETEPFLVKSRLNATETEVILDKLESDTYYWVRIIAETIEDASLPSDTVAFLTYPDDYLEPTLPPVTNLAHNLTECCIQTGMPELCWRGCEYRPNITAYYIDKVDVCYSHIGSVLACAADGRDHTDCCRRRNAQELCVGLCAHTKKGPLDTKYLACVGDTAKAVMCYIEGIVSLPRHPDVVVTEASKKTISLKWEQPKTSGRIDLYIIHYGISGQKMKMNVSTDKTSYILQNLLPGNPYEITVTSENENGTSVPSPVIIQYTASEDMDFPYYNRTFELQKGRALWENITTCCTASVSSGCVDQCLNKNSASIPKPECIDDSHNMLACFANGQDHRLCCEEKNLPSICVPLCAGHTTAPDYSLATCMSYAHRDIILSCFIENSGLIPGPPKEFSISEPDKNTVQLKWKPSSYCGGDCFYALHYWKGNQRSNAQTIKSITSGYQFQVPTADEVYNLTITASNSYGSSPPSAILRVIIYSFDLDVKIYLKSQLWYVRKGDRAVLFCSYINSEGRGVEIRWFYNGRRELFNTEENKLNNADQQNLIIENVTREDEGSYTCTVSTPGFPSVSDTFLLAVKREPEPDRVNVDPNPEKGSQGKLACWFYGLPDSDPQNWVHNGTPIRRNLRKYSMNRDEREHTGITSYRIKISNITDSDYGTYSISVSNSYGKSSCQVSLTNPDEAIEVITPSKEANPLQCCENKGVSGLCRELCGFDVNVTEVISDLKYLDCLQYFEVLVECGADGRDHTTCCNRQGVKSYCLPLCKGVVPGDVKTDIKKLEDCVLESDTIFQCAQEGHKLNPYGPRNVQLSLRDSGQTVLVSWDKPAYNEEKVQHYIVHYNTSDQSTPQKHILDDSHTKYRIESATQGVKYYVWIKSGSKHGNSIATEPVSIDVPKRVIDDKGPYDVKAQQVANSPDVRLTWEMDNTSKYYGYTVFYKTLNAARYNNIPGIKRKFYVLMGLEPNTNYQAYVMAVGSEANSAASATVRFTSGRAGSGGGTAEKSKSGDSDSKKVAIGVGVTIAIIALIAIIFLILFFACRARVFRPSGGETVTFENPGYGNQEQVKIQGADERFNYGRLQEEGTGENPVVYSNPDVGESSTDPAVENPVYDNQQTSNTAATLHVETNS